MQKCREWHMAKKNKPAEMPVHFAPIRGQEHFGAVDRALGGNTGPKEFNGKLMYGVVNTVENTNCPECIRLYGVRNKCCRGCGTMITDTSLKDHAGLCPKCVRLKAGIGVVDVDVDGVVIRAHGAAKGREKEVQSALDAAIEAKRLAKAAEEQYNRNITAGTPGTTEEQTMAKKTAEKPAAKAAPAKKSGIEKAQEVAAGKRAEKMALKIKVLVENPKRPGTKGFKAFACYKNGMTVGEFVKAGGTLADVRWDSEHNFIELS